GSRKTQEQGRRPSPPGQQARSKEPPLSAVYVYRRESQFHFKGLIISPVRSGDFSNQCDVTIRGAGASCRKASENDVGIAGRRYCRGGATAWPALRRFPSRARHPKTA